MIADKLKMDKWHIEWKDILWLIMLIMGFLMHWAAFQTRLGAVETVVQGPPTIDSRVTKLEQAYLDMHDMVKDIHDKIER